MQRQPWLALVIGFGGLLLLMLAAEIGGLVVVDRLQSSETQLHEHFVERSRSLDEIRSSIYLSGTVARDFLLAPAGSAHSQLADLNTLRARTAAALVQYGKALEPEEASAFASLKSEIAAYWKLLGEISAWTPEQRNNSRYEFFYSELVPRRTSMLQIADRVGQLNEQALQRGNEHLAGLVRRLQLALLITTGVTLLAGIGLAIYTSYLIIRLQREVRLRLAETTEARADLRELSAKLVRAQEEERRALSRELHDEAGQSFSAIMLEAENLLDMTTDSALGARLQSIRNMAERGIAETRNMALLLRPSMLDDFGLVPALNWQAKETSKRTGLRIQVAAPNLEQELPEEHKTCIYRVVQEALNNVARHAQARAVQISLEQDSNGLLLRIQDDGTGFDAQRIRGLGLLGMEERARHLGGSFGVDSQAGRGTLLKVTLPLIQLNQNGQV